VDDSNSIRIDDAIALRHYQMFTGYRGPNGQAEHPMRRNGHVARATATTGVAMAAVANVPGASFTQCTRSDQKLCAVRTRLQLLQWIN